MMPASLGKAARGRLHRFPKRELSPLQRACLSLGLPIDARPRTNLGQQLRRAGLAKTAIEYLKCAKGEQARQIVQRFYSLKTATERKAVTIDHLILAEGSDFHQVRGLIMEGVSRVSEVETDLLIAMNTPDLIRKAIESAKTPGGHKDRELLLRIAAPLLSLGAPARLSQTGATAGPAGAES
jgi:hypothetical protein